MVRRERTLTIPAAPYDDAHPVGPTLEPIRDVTRRRFQGGEKRERAVSFADLLALGLITEEQLNNLEIDD